MRPPARDALSRRRRFRTLGEGRPWTRELADPAPLAFAAQERDLLRRELGRHFGQDPAAADGLLLRTWRAGPQAGQPKLPPAVQSLLARGLVAVRAEPGRLPRAFLGSPHGLRKITRYGPFQLRLPYQADSERGF
jgi:hypothetical protein